MCKFMDKGYVLANIAAHGLRGASLKKSGTYNYCIF